MADEAVLGIGKGGRDRTTDVVPFVSVDGERTATDRVVAIVVEQRRHVGRHGRQQRHRDDQRRQPECAEWRGTSTLSVAGCRKRRQHLMPIPGFTWVEPRIPAAMAGPGCDGVVGRPPLGSPRSRLATERRGSTQVNPGVVCRVMTDVSRRLLVSGLLLAFVLPAHPTRVSAQAAGWLDRPLSRWNQPGAAPPTAPAPTENRDALVSSGASLRLRAMRRVSPSWRKRGGCRFSTSIGGLFATMWRSSVG